MPTLDERIEIRLLHEEGNTVKTIARRVDLSEYSVERFLHKRGIKKGKPKHSMEADGARKDFLHILGEKGTIGLKELQERYPALYRRVYDLGLIDELPITGVRYRRDMPFPK